AAEALGAGELGGVSLVVAVIAAADEEEAAGHGHGVARLPPLDLDRPARLLARPGGGDDPVAEPDPLLDPGLAGGVADIGEDRRAVGDRLRLHPGPEAVAERVHVGVRADARVAEEVPGAADRVARL